MYARAANGADRGSVTDLRAAPNGMHHTVIVVGAVLPVSEMSDRVVRVELGIPLEVAARHCGVSKNTLKYWEMDPTRARQLTRSKCTKFYKALRHALDVSRAIIGVA
jgi:uncharacterized protein (DUF2384 family)